jgi:selenocysteine-specific elongation factor
MHEVTTRHFIIATAGHVDHGKSALVKALTGTDPDRLPEEKKRQITIDLGFAELKLRTPKGDQIQAGIVDVPGHEDFVRNMIAGVGSIDLALFVVAADDGWMPQTEEHFQILTYLGIQHMIIALTKCDLGRVDVVSAEIREALRGTAFSNCQLVAMSARTGEGITKLKSALASQLADLPPPRDIGRPRMFVDRAFTLRGVGTVATGTLGGGHFRRGDEVVIQPRSIPARVRSIQNHGRDISIAGPGMRTAINLPEVSLGEKGIKRGDLVTSRAFGSPQATIDVLIERSSRLKRNSPAIRTIKNGSCVQVHFGTSRMAAKITFLDAPTLSAGQSAIAQLRLDAPVLAFVDDRFVIRDSSDRAKFRSDAQVQFLRTRAAAPFDPAVCIQSQLARDGFAESKTLLLKSNSSGQEILDAVSGLVRDARIVQTGDIAADSFYWRNLIGEAARLIDQAHKTNPERRGIDVSELRNELKIDSEKLFGAIVSELTQNNFARLENQIARVSHRPSLPPQLLSAAEKIRSALSARRFDPPDRKTFLQDQQLRQALRFLIDQGEIVEVGSDIVLLRDAAEEMEKTTAEFLADNRSATAGQIRERIGTTRRVIIPFLEYLDRIGVTRRIGDQRALAKNKAIGNLTDAPTAQRI